MWVFLPDQGEEFFRKVDPMRCIKATAQEHKKTIASINRGSRSINRAKDELSYLKSNGSDCDYLVVLRKGEFTMTIPKQGLRTHPEIEDWIDPLL